MRWVNEHLGSLAVIACSLTSLVLVYSWGDNVSPLTVIKRAPSALRLVVGGLFLVGTGNLVMWTPGIVALIAAEHWLGDWGWLLAWPGLMVGYYLLRLIHEPLLAVHRFISGEKD